MKFLLCLLFLFMGESLASPSSNQYIDTIINRSLQDVIRREMLDPAFLPNHPPFKYEKKYPIFGSDMVQAEFNSGTLDGLSRVKRHAQCQGPRNVTAGTMINCTLTFESLKTSHNMKVKYGYFPQVISRGYGEIRYTVVDVAITNPAYQKPRVTLNFRIFGKMTTDLELLDKDDKVLENKYREFVFSDVSNIIRDRFRYAFELAAANVPMPLR